MKKNKILVTRKLPEEVLARADKTYDCRFNDADVPWSSDELVDQCSGMDGVLCTSANRFTKDVLLALPRSIKIIATYSVGFEHIDLIEAKSSGITVTNTPEAVTESTADIALFLLLAAARRAREALNIAVSGAWDGWSPTQLLGIEPRGRRLGILGMGRIGQAVAKRARSFGMEIHYHNRNRLPQSLEGASIYHSSANELFLVSDFLSINCELTESTRKIINAETIDLFPNNPIIVNTSRGGVIDDEALIAALKSGRIAGAGLDVFDNEPDINSKYFSLENAFILPHIGSATVDCRNQMGFRALDNLDAFFNGDNPHDKLC